MAELGGALVREGKSSGHTKVVEGMMGACIAGGGGGRLLPSFSVVECPGCFSSSICPFQFLFRFLHRRMCCVFLGFLLQSFLNKKDVNWPLGIGQHGTGRWCNETVPSNHRGQKIEFPSQHNPVLEKESS